MELISKKFSWAFFIFLPLFNFSQIYNWSGSFGSYSSESGNAIDLDASGNTFIVGKYRNTVDFDPGNGAFLMTSEGESDIFILKLDANGQFLWVKVLEDLVLIMPMTLK